MLFNTVQYILYLLIIVLVYYCLPKKVRYIWLLAASYFFYMQWNALYIFILFSSTLLTYTGARIIEKIRKKEKNTNAVRLCFAACIIINLCILGFFKYFKFGIISLNRVLQYLHINTLNLDYNILLPVGISFYVLQSLGYLIDVYRGDIAAEKNFLKYALFVSFFPQLVAGPIERSGNLLVQFRNLPPFKYDDLRKGLFLILYGLFIKMVIADRAAIIVDTVYENSAAYPGFYIVVATVFFALQIYCDFYGYSTIARGSALLLGIKLTDNFAAPYFAKSVKEFWRRWHISLSGWFRDYLYIPIGGNRKSEVRKECNLLIVFAISGLWHGASFSFVFWGVLNAVYQIIANIKNKLISPKPDCFSRRLLQTIFTFALVTFSWLFFRAGGLGDSRELLANMFSANNWTIFFDGSLYGLGVARNYMNVLLLSILALFCVDYCKYKGINVVELVLCQQWYFRVLLIMLLLFAILLYGCYGEMYDIQQFIYFQF